MKAGLQEQTIGLVGHLKVSQLLLMAGPHSAKEVRLKAMPHLLVVS